MPLQIFAECTSLASITFHIFPYLSFIFPRAIPSTNWWNMFKYSGKFWEYFGFRFFIKWPVHPSQVSSRQHGKHTHSIYMESIRKSHFPGQKFEKCKNIMGWDGLRDVDRCWEILWALFYMTCLDVLGERSYKRNAITTCHFRLRANGPLRGGVTAGTYIRCSLTAWCWPTSTKGLNSRLQSHTV